MDFGFTPQRTAPTAPTPPNAFFDGTRLGLEGTMLSTLAIGAENHVVARLRCEHLAAPLGIDSAAPRLSWQMVAEERVVVVDAVVLGEAVAVTVGVGVGAGQGISVESFSQTASISADWLS